MKAKIQQLQSFLFFPALCIVSADISELKKSAKLRRNKDRIYYDIDLDIIILFGLTEFKGSGKAVRPHQRHRATGPHTQFKCQGTSIHYL